MVVKTTNMLISEIVTKVYSEMGEKPDQKAIETSEQIVRLLVEAEAKDNKMSEEQIIEFVVGVLTSAKGQYKDKDKLEEDMIDVSNANQSGKSFDPETPEWYKYTRLPYYGVERLARLVAELSIFVSTAVAVQFILSIIQRPINIIENVNDPKVKMIETKMKANANASADPNSLLFTTGEASRKSYEDKSNQITSKEQLKGEIISVNSYNQTTIDNNKESSLIRLIRNIEDLYQYDSTNVENTDKILLSKFSRIAAQFGFNMLTRWSLEYTFGKNMTNLKEIQTLVELFTESFDYDGLDISTEENNIFKYFVNDISKKEITVTYYEDLKMKIHSCFIYDVLAKMGTTKGILGFRDNYKIPMITFRMFDNKNNEVMRYEFEDCIMTNTPKLTSNNESAIVSTGLYFMPTNINIYADNEPIYTTK
jgi:hypothetical protein